MWSLRSPDGTVTSLADLDIRVAQVAGTALDEARAVGTGLRQTPWLLRLTLRPRARTERLAALRRTLVTLLSPDTVTEATPAYLQHAGAATTIELPVVYASGLEAPPALPELTLELRALALAWAATSDTTQSLPPRTTLASANYALERLPNGSWVERGGLDGPLAALLVAQDGTRYAGGSFAGRVARWDGAAWVALSGLNGDVTALAEGPNGVLYAGGSFTSPGLYVARWDGTAWVALGTPGVLPRALYVGPDGTLYSGGIDVGAGTTVQAWNGTSWSNLGSGPGGTVWALAPDATGRLVAGGAFAGGVRVWDTVAWFALGGGLGQAPAGTPTVRALVRDTRGDLFASGDFNQADGAAVGSIARWTGVAWFGLGSGLSSGALALAVRPRDNALLAAGTFTVAGGLGLPDRLALWSGTAWQPLDVNIAATPEPDIVALALTADESLLLGYGTTATATAAAVTTVRNAGSSAAYPVLTVTGPGRVSSLVNATAGVGLWFANLTLLPGETLTVDMRLDMRSVRSSFRGDLLGTLVPGSALATWRLLPGDNQVALFVDDAAATASLSWRTRWWVSEAG